MKPEDNQLLISDLYARLPYHVIVKYKDANVDLTKYARSVKIEECKPYLRPLSSMTAEEEIELGKLIGKASYNMLYKINFYDLHLLLEFIYKKHLDYNHLIEKELAIEAPSDMYI